MEVFLNEISEQFIQERVNRLKQNIEVQRKSIINKIYGYRKQLVNIMNSKVNKKSSAESMSNVDQIKNPSSLNKNSESKQMPLIHVSKQLNSQQAPVKQIDMKQSQNCFLLFQKACENILNTYFPLLMQDQFLSLQSQDQINQKLIYLNNVVEKTAVNLIKKLTKPDISLIQIKKDPFIQDIADKQQSSIEISCQKEQKTKKIKKIKPSKQEKHKKKGKNSKIPQQCTYVMQKWLLQNFQDPYPSPEQKHKMAQQSGLTVYQVNNWFINARQRVIKKFLKKDNSSGQINSRSSKFSEQQEQYMGVRKQKRGRNRKQSKSLISELSIRLSRSSQDKQEMMEEN